MDKQTAEQIYVSGWFAAASAYGGPAEENEEVLGKGALCRGLPGACGAGGQGMMDIFGRKRIAELEAQLSEEKDARGNSDVAHAKTVYRLRNALGRIEELEANQRNAHMLDGLAREFAGKPMNSVDLEGIKAAFLKAEAWIAARNGQEVKA